MSELKQGEFYGEPQRVSFHLTKGNANGYGTLIARGDEYSRVRLDSGNTLTVRTKQITPLDDSQGDNPVDNFVAGEWIRVYKLTSTAWIEVIAVVQRNGVGQLTLDHVGVLPEAAPQEGVLGSWTFQRLGTVSPKDIYTLMEARRDA